MLVKLFKYLLVMKPFKQTLLYKTLLGFFLFLVIYTVNAQSNPKSDKPFVVVLDAGHGGKDSGNRGNGYYEKKLL